MEDLHFLNYFITEDIYLIDHKDSTPPPETPVSPKKHLAVIAGHLSEEDRAFLFKIFESVEINPDMLKITGTDFNLNDHPTAIFFGTQPGEGSLKLYHQYTLDDCVVIAAHSLSEIAGDNTKKRKLWKILQSCFS